MASRSGKPEKVRVFSNTDNKPRKSQEIVIEKWKFQCSFDSSRHYFMEVKETHL